MLAMHSLASRTRDEPMFSPVRNTCCDSLGHHKRASDKTGPAFSIFPFRARAVSKSSNRHQHERGSDIARQIGQDSAATLACGREGYPPARCPSRRLRRKTPAATPFLALWPDQIRSTIGSIASDYSRAKRPCRSTPAFLRDFSRPDQTPAPEIQRDSDPGPEFF